MLDTPRANRLHIAIFGRRNAGKSSLINAITGQKIALVSEHAGTTTDPVYKAMELLPIGPIVMIDTAGLDDEGALGELRVQKTKEVMDKTDLALLVFTPENMSFSLENEWYNELKLRKIPTIGVINKCEGQNINLQTYEEKFQIPFVKVSAREGINVGKLKEKIQENAPLDFERETILGDIIKQKDLVLLVAPQDIQAPKGRLILPQVQVLRDVLDNHAQAFTVTDAELKDALGILNKKPDLVVTDSQVFKKVNEILPSDVELTSFSILMARYKGELEIFVKGAKAIDDLKPGDKVLIAEACTHHALKGDIGREKLPNWLEGKVGGKLDITVNSGVDFPENLSEYKLIVHCGACMFNRKQLMTRIMRAMDQNVPITNYGTAIAHINGILDRTTKMFKFND
ncbi:[FeFe] hydrogenase H-cluster maturation GTPase HydF [Clostridium omnivorum]|uniref:[FeFe] hydrogenase H-cluster maturation GTPase HydF n=1 Tax=Clostridium omnivorum TaxID=1604902 RepID=A0ABQ5NAE3_9CLOT|nr:[FeFe] hydrogenase H-cluster maturation GTPase HydF [Clostridium sp. E14]GLC32162.1 [FeFe] hydrogenase H-cluster maturation GTPase HydF [Clostridium sp. E14]